MSKDPAFSSPMGERVTGYLNRLDRVTGELEQLTNDIVELQAIDRNQIVLNPDRIRLRTVIEQLEPVYQKPAAEKKNGFEFRITTDQLEAELWVDQKRLMEGRGSSFYLSASQNPSGD